MGGFSNTRAGSGRSEREIDMDARENALRALRLQSPERIPYAFWRWGPCDFEALDFSVPMERLDETHERDEFGCVWEKPGGRTIGFVVEHSLADPARLERYHWPDPDDSRRFDGLRAQAERIREKGRAVTCGWLGGLWERLWFLLGLDNTFVRVYENPEWIAQVIDRLSDFQVRLLKNAQEATGGLIDVWTSTDDWGLQTGPFLPPSVFVSLFVPRYSRIFSACHKSGMIAYLHSDGKMTPLLPGLVDAGLDVIQVEDLRVKGIEELAKFCGRICFQCTLDAQSTMPSGDHTAITAEAKEIVQRLASPQGGLVASIYWDPYSCGVNDEVQSFGVGAYREACERYTLGLRRGS
jgi:uroporphyrinogen decarboxylase